MFAITLVWFVKERKKERKNALSCWLLKAQWSVAWLTCEPSARARFHRPLGRPEEWINSEINGVRASLSVETTTTAFGVPVACRSCTEKLDFSQKLWCSFHFFLWIKKRKRRWRSNKLIIKIGSQLNLLCCVHGNLMIWFFFRFSELVT